MWGVIKPFRLALSLCSTPNLDLLTRETNPQEGGREAEENNNKRKQEEGMAASGPASHAGLGSPGQRRRSREEKVQVCVTLFSFHHHGLSSLRALIFSGGDA